MIEEVAGAVKDLIRARRVGQFGMSEAAAGTVRLHALLHTHETASIGSRRSAAGHLTSRPMVMSTPQPPTRAARRGLAAGCGWPVRALTGVGYGRRL